MDLFHLPIYSGWQINFNWNLWKDHFLWRSCFSNSFLCRSLDETILLKRLCIFFFARNVVHLARLCFVSRTPSNLDATTTTTRMANMWINQILRKQKKGCSVFIYDAPVPRQFSFRGEGGQGLQKPPGQVAKYMADWYDLQMLFFFSHV